MKKASVWLVLLALVAVIGCQKQQEDQAAGPVVTVDSVASADSVMIQYKSYGAGDRAVVFVHGWSCDGSYWERQVEAFKDDYQVVTLDLAGHGQSGTSREEWTMQHFGDDVAAVVNDLGLKQVALVAHSMGGAICIEAARRLDQQTVVLIGVDTYQGMVKPSPPERVEAFIGPFREDFVKAVGEFIPAIFGPNADSTLVREVTEDISQADSVIAIACFEEYNEYDVTLALPEMRKPIRAINSDLWPTDVEGNKQRAESFEVDIIEGVGHFPQLEVPGDFNIRLRKVLHEFWPPETQE